VERERWRESERERESARESEREINPEGKRAGQRRVSAKAITQPVSFFELSRSLNLSLSALTSLTLNTN